MSLENVLNIENEKNNRDKSINEEINPIILQLIEFGYDNLYSKLFPS